MTRIDQLTLSSLFPVLVLVGCFKGDAGLSEDDENSSDVDTETSDATSDGGTSSSGMDTVGDEPETETESSSDGVSDLGADDCDPFAQDCPDGQKCVPYASSGAGLDASKCVDITGDGQAGDPCTSTGPSEATDDCGADSFCWDVQDIDGQSIGVCTEFCQGMASDPICSPGTSCLDAVSPVLNLCVVNCDPLLQDCGANLGCYWSGAHFNCMLQSVDIPAGEPCSLVNDCAPGNICVEAGALPSCAGSSCCTVFCDLSDSVCTIVGTECVSFYEEGQAPPGYENVGVCVLPGA